MDDAKAPLRHLLLAAAATVLVACGGGETLVREATVTIVPDGAVGSYEPGEVRVVVGGVVEWVNESGFAHNVVFDDEATGASPLFAAGESWSTRFDEVGSFPYVCTLHPTMVGTVVVVDEPVGDAGS